MNNVLSEGGVVTLLGILVVFVCLALIILVVVIMSWILKDRPKKKPEPALARKIEQDLEKPLPPVPEVEVENLELVAVLTAAVAAFMETNPSGLVVRSFRRIPGESAWARASRSAQIYNKF